MTIPINKDLRLVNWNIGGAKYLQLRSKEAIKNKPNKERDKEGSREDFRENLNVALKQVITAYGDPHIITLQEFTEYHPEGLHNQAESIVDQSRFEDYELYPFVLIDTVRHSAQGKWYKVRELGEWEAEAYFGQGNAIMVHRKIVPFTFPVWSLPAKNVTYDKWRQTIVPKEPEIDSASRILPEHILLMHGLYFGDRNTEPRAASVYHFCTVGRSDKPLDIFVINAHLTTLMLEREGIPSIDKESMETRMKQLDTIFDGIVSRYNKWRKSKYRVRDKEVKWTNVESIERENPIWLLAGDFNFTPQSEEYRYVLGRNFADLRPDHRLGTKTSGLGQTPTLTVDYVFAGPLFESIDPRILRDSLNANSVRFDKFTRVSDHFPVQVTIPLWYGD